MITYSPVNLGRIQRSVTEGRLDAGAYITMKDLRDCGAAGKRTRNGFKLLAKVRTRAGRGPRERARFHPSHGKPSAPDDESEWPNWTQGAGSILSTEAKEQKGSKAA